MSLNLEFIFLQIYEWLQETDFYRTLIDLWEAWIPWAIALSLFFLGGCVYAYVRKGQIYDAWRAQVVAAREQHQAAQEERAAAPGGRSEWEQVLEHIASENESNWRLAIIEADIMLDRLIEGMGYPGENLGERLRGINRTAMRTIDEAWEAHKVRNQIAHQGAAYSLSQREARRVIDLYRQVFEELNYI